MARIILLTDFSEEYAKLLLKGMVEYSKEHSPWVFCRMPHAYRDIHGLNGVLKWAKQWNADAIIGQFYCGDNVSIFKEHGIIAIAQDFEARFTEVPNITGAHNLAGKMGAKYFIEKGYKNFAFYGFKDVVWSEERRDGFKDELKNYDLGVSFFEYQNDEPQSIWHYESGALMKWLQKLPKPVGIMACDDNHGHHITELCKQYGIQVPERIAVLGVDNDKTICTLLSSPPLSSISQAVEKAGYEVAELIDKMKGNHITDTEDIIVYPTHIITRQSTDIYATEDKSIAIVLKYIHQNSDRKLNVDELVKLVPLSRRLFESRFKEVIGIPVYNYILNLRINKFAQLLLESNNSIVDIGASMGFVDYKNISRQFKRIKGCSPSEYRSSHTV